MVPDVFQIIVKEKGVFTNVTSPSTKAKLRILFEVAPIGLLVGALGQQAGPWKGTSAVLRSKAARVSSVSWWYPLTSLVLHYCAVRRLRRQVVHPQQMASRLAPWMCPSTPTISALRSAMAQWVRSSASRSTW
jgi:hypothetical protein